MTIALEELTGVAQVSDAVAALAARVQPSVAVVRGARHGGGSGIVWSGDGLIVTNHHVVPGEWAEVRLGRSGWLPARVVSRAADLDLVALQIEGEVSPEHVAPAVVGDSAHLRVGQFVVAVGNPLGERNAVTLGMVSGFGVPPWLGGRGDAIQVAITVRPGNSGGALADVEGRIVGIPNMVIGRGLALAVPAHVVERFLRAGR